MCQRTAAGRLQVSQEVHNQWQTGDRSELELALVRALKIHGVQDNHAVRQQVRVWAAEMHVLFPCFFFARILNYGETCWFCPSYMYPAFGAGGVSVAAYEDS